MGVIVNKKLEQDKLSEKINADLRKKALNTVDIDGDESPDFEEDSEYLKNLKKTGRFGWMWIVLIALALLALIPIFII